MFGLFVCCFAAVDAPAAAQDVAIAPGWPEDGALAISTAIPRPAGVARDGAGNLYFSSTDAGRVYKVDSSGRLYVIAGRGNLAGVDGMAAVDARLIRPAGLAVDAAGNLFIAEAGGNRIRKIDVATAVITTVAGSSGELNNPSGVAVDNAGNIFIADTSGHRVYRVDASTRIMTTIAGDGTAGWTGDGFAAMSARISAPAGVAVDAAGNVFIGGASGHLRHIDATTGIITSRAFYVFGSVSTDGAGNAYYISRLPAMIRRLDASSGVATTVAGNGLIGFGGDNATAIAATVNLNQSSGLVVDASRSIWIADSDNFRIRRIDAITGVIVTVAGTGAPADGGSIAVDAAGKILLANSVTRRIEQVEALSGTASTVAGGGAGFGGGDGGLATDASFTGPSSVAIDAAGNIFVGDGSVVRRVDAITRLISTVAGGPSRSGFGGDGGPAVDATLSCCFSAVALDGQGNLLIADRNNHRIRRVDAATGIIRTVAGNGNNSSAFGFGSSGADVGLKNPTAVAVDAIGNLFIADTGNQVILRQDAITGRFTYFATQLNDPQGLAFDAHGNLFILEAAGTVRRVDATSRKIVTIATDGLVTPLNSTRSVAVDASGNLLIADALNARITQLALGQFAALSSSSVSFGGQLVGTTSAPRVLTFRNTGWAPVTITGIAITGDFTQTNTCGNLMPAGESCAFTVSFSPLATGGRVGTITIDGDAPGAPHVVTLGGVGELTPAVTWSPQFSYITYGTPLDSKYLNATANVAGTFVYTPPAGAVVPVGSPTLRVTFTATDTNYAPITKAIFIETRKGTPVITWATPAEVVYGTRLSATQLNATSNVPGTFTYYPAAGEVPCCTSATLSLYFSPDDKLNYQSTNASVTLKITKVTPVIRWPDPPEIGYGTPLGAQLNASVQSMMQGYNSGIFVYTPAAGTILSPGVHTLSATFAPINQGYAAATATRTITVKPAATVITWVTPPHIKHGTPLAASYLNAAANVPGTFVYTPTAGTVLDYGSQPLSATFTPADTATYNIVTTTVYVLVVDRVSATITWPKPADIIYGTDLSATQLNAAANVSGTFVYTPAAGTRLLPNNAPQTLFVMFNPVDTANYITASATVSILVKPSTSVLSLGVSATTVLPGGTVAAILQNGPGNRTDWIGMYASDGAVVDWKYLDGSKTVPLVGRSAANVLFAALSAAGEYTLKLSDGTTVLTSSPVFTVPAAGNITLAVDRTAALTGSTVTATVDGAIGLARDWVGLYAVGGSTLLDWNYLNGSQTLPVEGRTSGSLTFRMPVTPGTYQLRFLSAAAATPLATSATITVTDAALAVAASIAVPSGERTVAPDTTVSATITNGPGMARDWIGVYPIGNSSFIDWAYLNGSKTVPATALASGVVAVRMPTTPGSYVIRLYSAASTLLATSETVTVVANPVTLTVSPTTILAGGSVSATVTGGPGNRNDWLSIHENGSANYVTWVYLNGSRSAPGAGMANATTSIAMPTTPGPYTIKFYSGSTFLASSAIITVTPAVAAAATMTATPATIRPLGTVNATIAGAPGNATDWVALYPAGSSNYLEWKYLNGSTTAPLAGLANATVSFTMSATPGTYVLKFWGGGTLLATSETITVAQPTLTAAAAAAPGDVVTPIVANGPGKSHDWIGIYITGASNYVDWVYLNGAKAAPASGMPSAAVPLVMPVLPGSYTLKFYTGATELAVSEPVIVR